MSQDQTDEQSYDNRTKGGLTRRSALTCMSAWAGTGLLWAFVGGVPRAFAAGDANSMAALKAAGSTFSFAQISDTHIGFDKAANPEPLKTMHEAIYKINEASPSLILHTGDITHLSKASEFDTAAEALKEFRVPVHYVPGEHDTLDEGGGKLFLERYGKGTKGNGWYSFDDHGVHFVALVNVFGFKPGHEASIGDEQMKWLADDLKSVSSSTPVVVFTHIPLWSVYKPWGWGTEDGDQAVSMLRRFGSVTVLNGHIHQVIQKVEGNITFHTARATAYPQPAPGAAPSPGPMAVPPDKL
jgi:3',5'-cyclic AMP phosphodiesterase CpdA